MDADWAERGIAELPPSNVQVDARQIERLQKMIVGDLRAVRPLLPSWALFLAFALGFVAVSFLGVYDLGAHAWLLPEQKVVIFVTLGAGAAVLAFSLARQMVPGQKWLLRPGLLPAALFALLCLVVASVFRAHADPHFLRRGEFCFKSGVPYAVPAALVFWLILRRGAMLTPRVAGAMAGLLAGFVSTTVLEVYCPNPDVWHILIWHVGIALLGMLSGLLIAIAGEAIRNLREPGASKRT